MYGSRSEKILAMLKEQNNLESEQVGSEVNGENKKHFNYNDSPKELCVLQPLQPIPSTSFENNEQVLKNNESLNNDSNELNITASTAQLIDECLAHSPILIDQINNISSLLSSPELQIENVPNQVGLTANKETSFIDKGFMCYHCSIIFENKKILRSHIGRRHMGLEETESEEDLVDLDENDKTTNPPQKKKKLVENKATTKKKRQERKCLRVAGKSYTSVKGNKVKERERKEFTCDKCHLKCNSKFSDDEKNEFFCGFWKMGEDDNNQVRQRQYIISHIVQAEPERFRKHNVSSRKKRTLHYYLEKGSERVRVCRMFFLSVFSISEKFVRVCLEKKNDVGVVSTDLRGKKSSANKIPDWIEQHARQHILSIPTVESHYCRKSSNKLYLSSQLNIEKLYSLYIEKCQEENSKLIEENEKLDQESRKPLLRPVSKSQYKIYFYSYGNLRFHKPKKDQCSNCNHYESLTIEEKEAEKNEHDRHLKNKERVRELKKEKVLESIVSNGKRTVINFDLQAVLECPKGQVSSIFYKRKLAVYNLTVFDLISKEGTCNIWDETEGNRGSTEIGTCIFNYIKDHPNTEDFFLLSDSCGGQNLNQYLSTALLNAVRLTNCNLIDHVFYEPGHSQQEGDSMHATIERAAKNVQVNVPSEWGIICQTARKTPEPYIVNYLTHDSFIDWTLLASKNKETSRYKTLTGEVVEWRKVKWFRYIKNKPDSIFFKYNYDDDSFLEISIKKSAGRPQQLNSVKDLPKAYKNRLKLSAPKHKDLMDLCKARVIPLHHHRYFEELPKQDNTINLQKKKNERKENKTSNLKGRKTAKK